MDKSWITKQKWSRDYAVGVQKFLEFASQSKNSEEKILCPCKSCINRYFLTLTDVKTHLVEKGFFPGYIIWSRHGEEICSSSGAAENQPVSNTFDSEQLTAQVEERRTCDVHELLRDTFDNNENLIIPNIDNTEQTTDRSSNADKFTKLFEAAAEELYPGCKSFSKLAFILQLYRLKCLNSWSTVSFDMLLELLQEALPDGTLLPKNTYEVKKMLKAFDMGYKKIDACPNDCMLFWGDDANKEECQNCGSSRWDKTRKSKKDEGKKSSMKAAKIVRYFPLIPRLQRLFKQKKQAEDMIWHHKYRNKDGLLRHPADGEAWKTFDRQFPDFASDPRNIRLGLSTDGFNPYKIMSSTYSIWPVILVPYNMAPWIGMKQNSFILSTLIPGEKSPGNNIDIYLQPLIKELQELWHGVHSYDAATGQNFILRAALLWTINDFPAYGMLSGWSTKGRFACPCCAENTDSLWLYKSKKFSYMGHRRWLAVEHFYRRQKQQFNNKEECRHAPQRISGSDSLMKLQNLKFTFGISKRSNSEKYKRKSSATTSESQGEPIIWKKKNIFFQLHYWQYNLLPHNLDVMHIEKNICENFIGTLMGLDKSKDNLQARQDLIDIGIKNKLHPQVLDSGTYVLPAAAFTMTKPQTTMMCEVLKNMKLPKSYASNISRCVNLTERKISGLKSHDCHVIIEDILPVALASCAPSEEVLVIINSISRFLKSICANAINPEDLDNMQQSIVMTLCEMEKCFLPSFFTIMIHLLVHLVEEVRLGGPVHYRWMYPFERFFLVLKNYVGNKAQPEGSIAEGYIAEEGINLCSKYLNENVISQKCKGTNDNILHYKFTTGGTSLGKVTLVLLDEKSLIQAHRYVLRHCDNIEVFRAEFISNEKRKRRRHTHLAPGDIEKLLNECFHDWFKQKVAEDDSHLITDEIRALAIGPSRSARSYTGFSINGYTFHVKDRDENRKTQNFGVVNTTEIGEFNYFGRVKEIIDIDYSGLFHIVLFKCEWANTTLSGIKKNQFDNYIVNFSRLIHTGEKVEDDPYVFASQVEPIFFIPDPKNTNWNYVIKAKPREVFDSNFTIHKEDHVVC